MQYLNSDKCNACMQCSLITLKPLMHHTFCTQKGITCPTLVHHTYCTNNGITCTTLLHCSLVMAALAITQNITQPCPTRMHHTHLAHQLHSCPPLTLHSMGRIMPSTHLAQELHSCTPATSHYIHALHSSCSAGGSSHPPLTLHSTGYIMPHSPTAKAMGTLSTLAVLSALCAFPNTPRMMPTAMATRTHRASQRSMNGRRCTTGQAVTHT
jgi:hypothetical protein